MVLRHDPKASVLLSPILGNAVQTCLTLFIEHIPKLDSKENFVQLFFTCVTEFIGFAAIGLGGVVGVVLPLRSKD